MTTKTNTTNAQTKPVKAQAKASSKTSKKKFCVTKASKTEFDREIRRLATAKCISGQEIKKYQAEKTPVPEDLQAKYDAIVTEYDRIRQAKAKRFPGRKTYMDMSAEEIKSMNLKTCVAAIASLHSKKSRYPEHKDAVMKKMSQYMARKDQLQHEAEVRETLKGMSKNALEALMAAK